MTRKRFIKLLRSRGYSRAEIESWTELASQDVSYDQLFNLVANTFDFKIRNLQLETKKAVRSLMEVVKPVVSNIAKALHKIGGI